MLRPGRDDDVADADAFDDFVLAPWRLLVVLPARDGAAEGKEVVEGGPRFPGKRYAAANENDREKKTYKHFGWPGNWLRPRQGRET
jgi:hypothetical protein